MKNDKVISTEKQQKTSVLSTGNNHKFFTDKEILPSDQRTIITQARFSHSALGKALEKHIKRINN